MACSIPALTIPLKLRIVAVCGATSLEKDDFLLSDFVLLHQLFPRTQNEKWLSCFKFSTPKERCVIQLHGYPSAERVVIEPDDFSWNTRVRPRFLKSKFLEMIGESVNAAADGEHILVLLSAHGKEPPEDSPGRVGGDVALGCGPFNKPIWISPAEVLEPLSRSMAHCTVLVNSCYSGMWKEEGQRLGLGQPREPKFNIITGCAANAEIFSVPISGSNRARGGQFINCTTNTLYNAYGLNLPRPAVCPPSSQMDNVSFIEIFPKCNLSFNHVENQPKRSEHSSLPEWIDKTGMEMRKMTEQISLPLTSPVGSNEDALKALGVINVPIRLWRVVPSNPPGGPDSYQTGCIADATSLDRLVQDYQQILNAPAETASNTGVARMISRYQAEMLPFLERWELRRILNKRLRAYRSATLFVKENRLSSPIVYESNEDTFKYYYVWGKRSGWMTTEGAVRWLVPSHLVALSLLQSGIRPEYITVRGKKVVITISHAQYVTTGSSTATDDVPVGEVTPLGTTSTQ